MTARRRRQSANAGKLLIDVLVQSPRWKARPRASALVRRAIRAAADVASTPPAELAIVLTDDSEIRILNREWRKVDAPTNVLSFPAANAVGPRLRAAAGRRAAPRLLGDIVIAYETVAREAASERKSFDHHLVHLAVHGFLHLLGHDHATGRDAAKMERLETAVLARLGIPDPYAAQNRE
ncbi:MAG TPA: rRNA maturation RNase YbeY [Xanthobacteraceae bacterium]|nr:rRNA maturation RNase YbeY [Xanthobacteraceae bacterium]